MLKAISLKKPIMGSTLSTGTWSALRKFLEGLGLSYQGNAIRDIRLDGNLVDGDLRLDASIGNLAGTKVQVAGILGGLERMPPAC